MISWVMTLLILIIDEDIHINCFENGDWKATNDDDDDGDYDDNGDDSNTKSPSLKSYTYPVLTYH